MWSRRRTRVCGVRSRWGEIAESGTWDSGVHYSVRVSDSALRDPTKSTSAAPNIPYWVVWAIPIAIFLGTFGMFAGTAERHGVDVDAYAASAEAWRLATSGTPWLDGLDVKSLHGVHAPIELGRWLEPSPNGHVVAHRMAGPVLAALPFYALLGSGPSTDLFSLGPGALAAAFWSALGTLFIYLALRRHASLGLAAAGALTYAFATPTWAVSANGVWTHTVTQPALAAVAWALSRDRWGLAGVACAVGMLGRPHVALIAAVVGVGISLHRRSAGPAVRIAIPTLGALLVLLMWNHWMFGVWSIAGSYENAADAATSSFSQGRWLSQLTNVAGFFVSPGRGLLVWTPALMLFLPALVRSWKSLPDWSRYLVVGGLLYSFFQMRLNGFSGGIGFYGYRHPLELVTCLVPALVFAAPQLGRWARLLMPVALSAQVAAVTIGAINEAYFIYLGHMWDDNGFWVALRYQPGVVGVWLALCLVVGVLVSVMIDRRRARPDDYAEPA